uniref:Uncharacterized protein n=1 Tax=Myoviridae sp. ct3pM2 TaxID=2827658 RepID=A0A8S5TE89_9CAUD|nr:MAG TPA: hypothetical protein [Myoviridae sp. ct3pM2]DAN35020.1 MAG TPA: hypothetical protein [Caudoviricetes sp.]DAU25321.1 MAG TPA: hypothetical protein [Caudoviricetes sp.]
MGGVGFLMGIFTPFLLLNLNITIILSITK